MHEVTTSDAPGVGEADPTRLRDLYQRQSQHYWAETDRLFAGLMVFQLLGGIIMALVVSPRTWIGQTSFVHLHVWSAILLGTLLTALPVYLALFKPGETVTRHVVAAAQMLWSALLIHLSGGRIETHFHVFGSLAFLAFYRDWKVVATATVVVAADHYVRGVYWPQSVFGVAIESSYRWIEHAAWVVFEDFVLVLSCFRGTRETMEICRRRVLLEQTNENIEQVIELRTRELSAANDRLSEEVREREIAQGRELQLGRLLDQSVNEVYIYDTETLNFHEVNQSALTNLGYTIGDMKTLTPVAVMRDMEIVDVVQTLKPLLDGAHGEHTFETLHHRKDGTTYPVELRIQVLEWNGKPAFVAVALDITERRRAQAERDEIHTQLVETSRMAGMAEIATGVLHNVGNVLNSVNVSATLIEQRIKSSRVSKLKQVSDLMNAHADDLGEFLTTDRKGQLVPKYIADLATAAGNDNRELLTEVASLNSSLSHIKEIVQMQQSYARVGGMAEDLSITDVVDEAIHVEHTGLDRHGISLVREYDDVPMVRSEKHKLLQILVNLIGNAKNAMSECDIEENILTLSVSADEDSIWVCCRDTGCGISAENLDRIFSHGFTTRANGHGFGLHSCATTAGELGGSLTVSSEGVGKGATFHLQIPMTKSSSAAATTSEAVAVAGI